MAALRRARRRHASQPSSETNIPHHHRTGGRLHRGNVKMNTWFHIVHGAPGDRELVALSAVPGLKLTATADDLPHALWERSAGYLLAPTAAAICWADRPRRRRLDRRAGGLVDAYGAWGDVERTLDTRTWKPCGNVPTWPASSSTRFSPDIVVQVAPRGRLLPTGITRFMIPGRILRLNAARCAGRRRVAERQGRLARPAGGRRSPTAACATTRSRSCSSTMTMLAVTFRFYGNLNDFLPGDRRNTLIEQRMTDHAAVKHPIETLGIPHTEVEAILVNRQAVDFAYRLDDGDRASSLPAGGRPLAARPVPLRPPTPAPVASSWPTPTWASLPRTCVCWVSTRSIATTTTTITWRASLPTRSVLLTRDRALLKHKQVVHGYCVRETAPRQQIVAVLRHYELASAVQPWRRCTLQRPAPARWRRQPSSTGSAEDEALLRRVSAMRHVRAGLLAGVALRAHAGVCAGGEG